MLGIGVVMDVGSMEDSRCGTSSRTLLSCGVCGIRGDAGHEGRKRMDGGSYGSGKKLRGLVHMRSRCCRTDLRDDASS
jgi:hypothetical protein